MENISDYTIYCTKEQIKKALELGAPIEINDTFDSYDIKESNIFYELKYIELSDGRLIEHITAEQMIGWLEEQGVFISIVPDTDENTCANYVETKEISLSNVVCSNRKEATLAAIDAALEYLINNKK